AYASNVPFPAAEMLVQRGVADDFSVREREQGKVPAQVNLLAPIANHALVGHAMLEEHALFHRHGFEELVKFLFIVLLQWTQRAFEIFLQQNFFGEFLKFEI